jgi:hypothetical protein
MRHPELDQDHGMEPGVGELLTLQRVLKELEQADEQEVRRLARDMARLVVVVYPSALRHLAREAAANLSASWRPAAAASCTEDQAGARQSSERKAGLRRGGMN